MALKDYNKAFRYGKKEYESRLLAGRKPTLESLDEILPDEVLSTESLGLVQIPIDQIVGTRYSGRSSAFASNFMPILESNTEFAIKWAKLSTSHEKEGIHEPFLLNSLSYNHVPLNSYNHPPKKITIKILYHRTKTSQEKIFDTSRYSSSVSSLNGKD